MVRPTLFDVSPVKLKYYSFMIGLEKCSGTCNVLFLKISVPLKEVKLFNIITNQNGAKAIPKHMIIMWWSCDYKSKFNSTTSNSNQKRNNNKTCQCECKNYHKCEKD